MKIAVIGGSGLIGSKLVAKLREHGQDAVSAALDTGVNTLTREGLTAALQGASVVVDVANSPTFKDAAVLEFFETSTRNLLDVEAAAGVGHHVALSIVGTDRLPQRLLPRQAGPGEADRQLVDPVLDRPRHPVLRVHRAHRPSRDRRRHRSRGASAHLADRRHDVARALAAIAVGTP